MNIPCPKPPARCFDDSNPFENLSSEGFDGIDYIARSRVVFFEPPLGVPNTVIGNPEDCVSVDSQEEADICAKNAAVQSRIGSVTNVYTNSQQQCSRYCDDGLIFTWVVPAGKFLGYSQNNADQTARTFACMKAYQNMICIGNLPYQPCKDEAYDVTVDVNSYFPATISLVSGSFPDGLDWEMTPEGKIRVFGTPTESGTFEFAFQADTEQAFMVKKFTMLVCNGHFFDIESRWQFLDEGSHGCPIYIGNYGPPGAQFIIGINFNERRSWWVGFELYYAPPGVYNFGYGDTNYVDGFFFALNPGTPISVTGIPNARRLPDDFDMVNCHPLPV